MKPKAKAAAKGATGRAGCVCLALTHPTSREVCVTGSFNEWHPSATPMIRMAPMIRMDDRRRAKELAPPPGRNEYRLVVDGQWVDDPAATEFIPNSFGTTNAVFLVDAFAGSPRVLEEFPELAREPFNQSSTLER